MSFVVRDLVTSWRLQYPRPVPDGNVPMLDGVLDRIQADLYRTHPQWQKRVAAQWAKRTPCATCGKSRADKQGKHCAPCAKDRYNVREKLRMRVKRAAT